MTPQVGWAKAGGLPFEPSVSVPEDFGYNKSDQNCSKCASTLQVMAMGKIVSTHCFAETPTSDLIRVAERSKYRRKFARGSH